MRKLLKTIFIIFAMTIVAAAIPMTAFAEKTVTADQYIYIGTPKSVNCGDNIYVVGDNTLFVFSYEHKLLSTHSAEGLISADGNGSLTVYSSDQGIFLLTNEGATKRLAGKSDAYCLSGATLYSASGNTVNAVNTADGSTAKYTAVGSVSSLCCVNGLVYYSVPSSTYGYSDIYCIDEKGESVLVHDYCRGAEKLLGGDALRYYGSGFVVNPLSNEQIALQGDVVDVARGNGGYYYLTGGGEMYRSENGAVSLVFACTSSSPGYFAFPRSVYTDFGKLFVMDYANNRVAVMSTDITYLSVQRPVSATSDLAGNLYVAGKNVITVFNSKLEKTSEITCPYGAISSITYSSGKLYVCADRSLYSYSGTFSQSLGDCSKIRAEYFSGTVYTVTERGVVILNSQQVVAEQANVIDFDIDYSGAVYTLTEGKVSRFEDGALTEEYSVSPDTTAISLSHVSNAFTDYGNVILTRSGAHSVNNLELSGEISIPDPNLEYTDSSKIIRTALCDTVIYENACSVKEVCSVKSGDSLIVGKYDIYETDRMSYVLYESEFGLKYGYVYKGMLSEPLAEIQPPVAGGTAIYENTAIYRFPSASAEKLVTDIGKGTYVTILTSPTYSAGGVEWYKVRFESKVGFIAKDMLSVSDFISTDERPQYNAKLDSSAELYELIGSVYVQTGKTLSSGTEIEIVGAYDENKEYTLVKYFDVQNGIVEAYVRTEHISVYTVTPLQVIGLICVGVIILLIIGVFVAKYAIKKKAV